MDADLAIMLAGPVLAVLATLAYAAVVIRDDLRLRRAASNQAVA